MSDTGPRPLISDVRIAAYLAERKPLPKDWISSLQFGPDLRGHRQAELVVVGSDGSTFEIRLRQNSRDPLAFSAILSVLNVDGTRRFRLRRYNGRGHGHRNRIERETLPSGFHIHYATERYQFAGFDEDAFAAVTDRYAKLWDAVECMIADCGFVDESPARLF